MCCRSTEYFCIVYLSKEPTFKTIHKPTQTNKSFLPREGNFVCTHLDSLETQNTAADQNRSTQKSLTDLKQKNYQKTELYARLICWKKCKLNRKRPWNFETCLWDSNTLPDCGKTEQVIAALLVGCWFRLQINYKFIINYEVLPLALLSRGLRKRRILKSSEPISVLFLASQSHKRSYLQLGDLLFYIPSMYRLISWCSDLWHLNRKDAYKKQRQSRRDPNTLPGPRQGQSKKGVHSQHPHELRCQRGTKDRWAPAAPAAVVPPGAGEVRARGRRGMWQGSVGREAPGRQGVLQGWVLVTFSFPPAASTSQLGSEGLFSRTVQIWRGVQDQQRAGSLHRSPDSSSPRTHLLRPSSTGTRVPALAGSRQEKGTAGGTEISQEKASVVATSGVVLLHRASRWGAEGGPSPASLCKAAVLGLSIPARGRDLVGLARASPQGGKETSTAHAAACFSAWIYQPCKQDLVAFAELSSPKTKACQTTGAAPKFSQLHCSHCSPNIRAQASEPNCHGMLMALPASHSHRTSNGKVPFFSSLLSLWLYEFKRDPYRSAFCMFIYLFVFILEIHVFIFTYVYLVSPLMYISLRSNI